MTDFPQSLFCYQIREMYHKMNRYCNVVLSKYGITLQKALVLALLIPRDGLNVKDIAAKMHIGSSAITGLLDRMETDGFVRRQPDPGDRRGQIIFVTERGKERQNIVKELISQMDERIRRALSRGDCEVFFKVAKIITALFDTDLREF